MGTEEEKKEYDKVKELEEKRERLEYLRDQMENLKEELREYRKSHFDYHEEYERLKHDIEYEFYLRDGGFPQREDGFRVKRIYPSLEEIFHERPPVVRDLDSIDWKTLDNKVYIKEFFDAEEEMLKEEALEKLRKENAGEASKIEERIRRMSEKMKVEIPPEIKQDFENLIGGDLTLRIGVLSIILSIIVGYNYLIATGYIPTWARVVVGLCIGSGFFGLSYFLFLRKMSIVSIVVGAGILSMYYTVYIAIHNYGLFTPLQAFSASIFITAGCIALALFYDKRDLAIVAIFGGYVAPFLASQGSDTYYAFLSYFMLLNIGMLTISYIKTWRAIHFISFAATLFFMMYWINQTPDDAYGDLIGLFIFASLFHILFYVMTVIFDLKEDVEFTDFDFYLSLANTLLYVYWGLRVISIVPEATGVHAGVFLLLVGVLKGSYVWLLFDKPNIDKRLLDAQVAAIILLLNISIYLIFEQNIYLNTLYAIEAVAMLWFGGRMKNYILQSASIVMMLFAISSMIYAWHLTYQVYPPETIKPFVNKGFWAGVVNFSAILFTVKYLQEDFEEDTLGFLPKMLYSSILGSLLLIIGYLAFEFELMFQTRYVVGGGDFRTILFFGYSLTYLLFIRYIIDKAEIGKYRSLVSWLIAIVVAVYTPWGYFSTVDLRDGFFDGHYPIYPFLVHYCNLGISTYLMYLLISDIVKFEGYKSSHYGYAIQLACVLFVAHTTVEYEHLFVLIKSYFSESGLEQLVSDYRATSFTVLWALLSLLMMVTGMRIKIKEIRLMSLFLFALTIVKFFIVDFWRMDTIGKIISFLIIGAVLILVSQLYRRQLEALVEHGELALDKDATLSQDQAAALARAQRLKKLQEEALKEEQEANGTAAEADVISDEEDVSRANEMELTEEEGFDDDEEEWEEDDFDDEALNK